MSTVPDRSLEQRIASLERRIVELEYQIAPRQLDPQWMTPITGRLWLFSMNEDMGASTAGEAAADLVGLDETDTLLDVTINDPWDIFTDLENAAEGLVLEQMDVTGSRYFTIIQAECPPS